MERMMMNCAQCAGDGVCRPCRGCGRSGYFLALPGPDAKPCPHCKASGRCCGCHGSGRVIDWSCSFEPDVYVLASERMPSSISCAAATGAGWRYLQIPVEIQEQSQQAQQTWVSERVREHYRDSGGKCPLFGNTISYAWRYARGQSIHFDVRGRVLHQDA